jgi:hypothetical protein
MLKRYVTMTGILGALFLGPSVHGSEIQGGEYCSPLTPADAPNLEFTQYGVNNESTAGSAGVSCPVLAESLPAGQVNIIVYDRNSAQNADVSCFVLTTDALGNTNWSGSVHSTGSGAAAQVLSIRPAVGGVVHLQCFLPAKTSAGVSHVAAYYLSS